MHDLYRGKSTSRAGADESCVRREAIRDALSRWVGFTLFIDDGRIENEYHFIDRSMRPIASTGKPSSPVPTPRPNNGQSSLR